MIWFCSIKDGLFAESGPKLNELIASFKVFNENFFSTISNCSNNCWVTTFKLPTCTTYIKLFKRHIVIVYLPSRISCIISGTRPRTTWKYCSELSTEFLTTPNVVGMCTRNGPSKPRQCSLYRFSVRSVTFSSLNYTIYSFNKIMTNVIIKITSVCISSFVTMQ